MRLIRVLAIAVLVLVGLYFTLRAAAAACSGTGCDVYIPASILVPTLTLLATAAAGMAASLHARGHGAWSGLLPAVTALAILGPLVALVVLRNSPDYFIAFSAGVVVVVAATALAYSYGGRNEQI